MFGPQMSLMAWVLAWWLVLQRPGLAGLSTPAALFSNVSLKIQHPATPGKGGRRRVLPPHGDKCMNLRLPDEPHDDSLKHRILFP